MAHFQKNLLEAFQDANDERAGGDPASAGPFAGQPPDEPLEPPDVGDGPQPAAEWESPVHSPGSAPAASARPRPAAARQSLLPALSMRDARVLFAFLGVALASFVVGLAVGHGLGGSVQAGGGSAFELGSEGGPGDAGDPGDLGVTLGGGFGQLEPGQEVNAALLDPANGYTVLAVTYDDNATQIDLANATYFHFAEMGLPVAHPMQLSGHVYILVGAAAARSELSGLRDTVRELLDPDGREAQYAEAYVLSIDSVVAR